MLTSRRILLLCCLALFCPKLAVADDAASREITWQRTRVWLLYFALFAKAFERNTVSVFQTLASRRRTGPSGLPLARDSFRGA